MQVPADELHGMAYNYVLHGAHDFPAVALLIDPAGALVAQGLGGVVIGVVYAIILRQEPSAPSGETQRMSGLGRSLAVTTSFFQSIE